jgi:hypothetical protein
VAGVNRLKAGPENLNLTLSSNQKYLDPLYSGREMIYWDGDYVTTSDYSGYKSAIDSGYGNFKGW